jgi:hypothetical protein
MKLYALEYDFKHIKGDVEHKTETFSDPTEFIKRAEYINSKYYFLNIVAYSGEVNKVPIDRVLNPF